VYIKSRYNGYHGLDKCLVMTCENPLPAQEVSPEEERKRVKKVKGESE
jgi:hypothetical protein